MKQVDIHSICKHYPNIAMNDQKTAQVNLRMSPKAKELLRAAAEKEHRSASNMVEHLVLAYCELHDIATKVARGEQSKMTVKGTKQ